MSSSLISWNRALESELPPPKAQSGRHSTAHWKTNKAPCYARLEWLRKNA